MASSEIFVKGHMSFILTNLKLLLSLIRRSPKRLGLLNTHTIFKNRRRVLLCDAFFNKVADERGSEFEVNSTYSKVLLLGRFGEKFCHPHFLFSDSLLR